MRFAVVRTTSPGTKAPGNGVGVRVGVRVAVGVRVGVRVGVAVADCPPPGVFVGVATPTLVRYDPATQPFGKPGIETWNQMNDPLTMPLLSTIPCVPFGSTARD